ncbi:MAG TPA: hypothetical protein VLA31_06660 [Burkholderiaceae bacterium]|nr:hypothetical protein [Burkholderiaceae bacterium]
MLLPGAGQGGIQECLVPVVQTIEAPDRDRMVLGGAGGLESSENPHGAIR